MTVDLFGPLMAPDEQTRRSPKTEGLRFAEVARLEDEGYILTWLSGAVATESAPARVASFMAGPERGAFFMPEPGDEVVVGFENGDLDKPVILGALWSDIDAPPVQGDTSEFNNIRTIVSRQKHELTFDDTSSAASVTLKSAGGLKLVLDDSTGTITLQVDDGNKIEISAAGVKVVGTVIDLNP